LIHSNSSSPQNECFQRSVSVYNTTAGQGYEISFSDGIVAIKPDPLQAMLSKADSLTYEADG
jgi:hypothetical protein